jgi:hypothetical protein
MYPSHINLSYKLKVSERLYTKTMPIFKDVDITNATCGKKKKVKLFLPIVRSRKIFLYTTRNIFPEKTTLLDIKQTTKYPKMSFF